MNAKRRVLLYGNSVILGSIGAGLRRCSEFEVKKLTTPLQDSTAVDTAKYDMILFDLEASQPEAPFFLLKTHPDLVLIGLSPGINLVRVWNSQKQFEMSLRGLLELIKNGAIDSPALPAEQTVMRKISAVKDIETGF